MSVAIDPRTWTRADKATKQTYLASTRREYLDERFINAAFATEDMHWAKPLGTEALQIALDNSLVFGIYVTTPPTNYEPEDKPAIYSTLRQIGLARLITDYVTFAYLTDVFVDSEFRGKGLAVWIVQCCNEMLDKMRKREGGDFRTVLLLTSNMEIAVPMYEKHLGMVVPEQSRKSESGPVVMATRFKKHDGEEKAGVA